jgi:hypothetical protein
LLAIDRDGRLVVIELKRDDSGRSVELQAIKYAAYCSTLTLSDVSILFQQYLKKSNNECSVDEAKKRIVDFIENDDFEELNDRPRIIIASKEFRSEVTATVLWLRNFGVDITCVKVTPYEMDEGNIAFESNILIPLPEAKDFLIQAEKKEDIEHNLNLTQEAYISFYGDLIKQFKNIVPREYILPSPKSYYQISTGVSGIHFEWGFHGRPRSSFGVELHFEKGDRNANKKWFDALSKFIPELEKETGEKVILSKDWGRTWARFYIEKDEGKMTEDLKTWAAEKMGVFYKILQPEILKLKEQQ